MSDLESITIRAGDTATAVGTLTHTRDGYELAAYMEGRYLELSRELGGETARVHGLNEPPLGKVVTVRGIWTGSEMVDAEVSEGAAGVKPPRSINPRTFREVEGVAERSDILSAEVLEACDELRGRSLVSFVAVPGARGWFGLASAVDADEVLRRLSLLLGPHLVVTSSEWTLAQIQQAERLISEDRNSRDVGTFWDASGRYRAHCLLHHLTPQLAASLHTFPNGIVHVETWLTPAA